MTDLPKNRNELEHQIKARQQLKDNINKGIYFKPVDSLEKNTYSVNSRLTRFGFKKEFYSCPSCRSFNINKTDACIMCNDCGGINEIY